MTKHVAQYAVTIGLAGCYMPDSHLGAFQFDTRAELAAFIRSEIEGQGFPKYTLKQARLRDTWERIARHGSSVQHFRIEHDGREIAFHGLTNAEFDAMNDEDSF